MSKIFIILLSTFGFYISLYFTLVNFNLIHPLKFPIPSVCKLSENACQLIIKTKYARLFGLPNFVYGLIYYLGLIVFVISGASGYIKILVQIVSALVVVLGIYLSYVLVRILKVSCVLCFLSHFVNLLIAILIF
ncbi:vitamin K epoxide reductase family protein [Candidatus Chrysopegis kryptomonas]|uniref:Vitamin K epoxide reductase family protein n=1 Tax=Candidatus Chryseopegocella kryptomonas TaxID=1633643 RepID=A0A0P1NXF9_9BACT|nr:vitamin K epoxide reductase family protein [Candidatus Chrysopegis kryptomonas]CUT04593.1 Vitamin K epoxide reductase family protein [Candidatus Chrysopegis kryptomonas]